MELIASRSCFGWRARRRASFSWPDSVKGMFSAERSWLNWSCVSAGDLGWTAGELEKMHAWRTMALSSG